MTSVRAPLSGLLYALISGIPFPLDYPCPLRERNDKTFNDRVVGIYIVCASRG